MREIKFRAWGIFEDNPKPTMWTNFDVVSKDGEIFYGGEAHPEWILMQYTGLKDKNGKEIYEGDLIKKVSRYPQNIGEVIFIFGAWSVEYTRGHHPLYVTDDRAKEKYHMNLVDTEHFENGFEVVGNVYENPELLKKPVTPKEKK